MVSLPSSSSESASSRSERYYREIYGDASSPNASDVEGLGLQRTLDFDLCGCGILITVQASWTTKNPGHRFVQCTKRNVSNGRNGGCGMWDWVDRKFPDQVVNVLNDLLKSKRDLLAARTDIDFTLKLKERKILALKKKISEGCACAAVGLKLEELLRAQDLDKEV